jgi:signal transduction histidine kinase
MQSKHSGGRQADRLIGGMAVLSVAVVATVMFALASGYSPERGLATTSFLPAIAVNVGVIAALLLGIVSYRNRLHHAEQRIAGERRARGEANRQRDAAVTVAAGDAATIIMIEPGQFPRLIGAIAPELPHALEHLLDGSRWLTPADAHLLAFQLQNLVADGKNFTSVVTTLAGREVEIDGQAGAAGAMIRFRDVTARRHEVIELQRRLQRLQRELKLWRGLSDALPMPVWLRGADNRLDWVNMAYVRAVDALSRDDVRLRQAEWLDDRQRLALDQAVTQQPEGRGHRERMLVAQGNERRAYDIAVVPLPDKAGSAAIAMDVASGPAVLGAARVASPIDRTLDRVATAVAIFGPDQRLDFVNEAYRKLWKLEPAWLAARPRLGEILDRLRETRQLPEEADYRAWKRRQLRTINDHVEVKDSWHLPNSHSVNVLTVPRPDGGVTCLYDDVTERIGLESRLNALLHVQSETLDHLKEGVAVFGTDGKLRLFNSAFARIWQLDAQDLAREPHVEEVLLRCRALYADDQTWHNINRSVTGIVEQRQRIEGQMVRPDDSVVAYAGLPLPDGALLLTFVDVTDSKRAERMLMERNEALETADRLKDQFVSHVSYELRVPLQSIIGFSDLLSSPVFGPLNVKQREYVDDIASSSRTLLAIINDILDLATIDAGAFELKLAPVNVERVIHEAAAGVAERVARAHLDLRIEIEPDVAGLIADEHRLKQVLYNLLSNATGFSEDGDAVALVCRREAGVIIFEVEDEGVGIPHEQQRHVFDRFVSRPHGSRHRGAGLGLAMVRSLVELHGGTVELISEPGMGTRVTIRLPERAIPSASPERRPQSRPRTRDAA